MKTTNIVVIIILAVLIAGGGGFYGGLTYQKGKQPSRPSFTRNGNFPNGNINGQWRGGVAGSGARGEVTAVNGSTITVKQTDGSSKLVILGGSTTVTNTVPASLSDVTVGATIMAIGTTNSDGSVTASSIQLNPSTSGFGAPAQDAPPTSN